MMIWDGHKIQALSLEIGSLGRAKWLNKVEKGGAHE